MIVIFLNASLTAGITGLIILLIGSALISGAEVALFSLSQKDLDEAKKYKSKSFEIIIELLKKPKKLLASILVANNFINIAIVILFASISNNFYKVIDSELDLAGIKINPVFLIEVVLITFLILLFGEILPKVYANRNNLKFSKFMAYPLKFLDIVISPISIPMQKATLLIHKKLGNQKLTLNVEQLSQALELASDEDTTQEEQKILKGIVSFGNIDTKQVMRPRIDIFALDEATSYVEIVPEILKNGYSRIPVYKNSIDSVIGVLHVKDLLPHLQKKQFNWTDLLRTPFFIPENKKLDDLMVEFQEKKNHLAVVVDEYGGTSGIVSLEDIIEEIVGDISDEFDDNDLTYSKLDANNFVFEGKTTLRDFYNIIKPNDISVFEEKKGEAETLAGFVLEISNSFPKINNKINFKTYSFTVEAMSKKRIKQLKVTLKR
ncbi:MAG: gliding motility-associated protein GldE [Flavobacteriaceae bacterium]|nr:gliding motility-associated protein GldE [Flavobacteriaceae bacterium]